MKHLVQTGLRAAHALVLQRPLPRKLGVYLHELPAAHHAAFRAFADHFRRAGYRFATPDDFLADPAERALFLSFDDAYRHWFEALPLFEALGVTATFYVNTAPLRDRATPAEVEAYFDRLRYAGPRVPLSTDEVRALAAAGHTVGAHTHTHPNLAALPFEAACDEIRRNKEELEALLGAPVRHFAYPYGLRRYFSERLRAYCLSIGFTTVANAIPGLQHAPPLPERLQRSGWHLHRGLAFNLRNLRIDGRFFERLTGRSAVG